MKATMDTAAIATLIRDFWDTSTANCLHMPGGERCWDPPLVGFARGDDPLFGRLKDDIGSFYWTPAEIFGLTFPETTVEPEELSVISYVLPQTEATRREQRQAATYPAERWARSRFFGEAFNRELRTHLAKSLSAAGFPAVAPERSHLFDYRRSERYGWASNWSERHTAFIAGLGTFGLSDGLITERGKAVRFGSVVARVALPPTPRPYGEDRHAYCLWFAKGTCRACISRCPAGTITESGHDKDACHAYIRKVTAPYATAAYGTDATACGLCQVRIPCEERIPAPLQSSRAHALPR